MLIPAWWEGPHAKARGGGSDVNWQETNSQLLPPSLRRAPLFSQPSSPQPLNRVNVAFVFWWSVCLCRYWVVHCSLVPKKHCPRSLASIDLSPAPRCFFLSVGSRRLGGNSSWQRCSLNVAFLGLFGSSHNRSVLFWRFTRSSSLHPIRVVVFLFFRERCPETSGQNTELRRPRRKVVREAEKLMLGVLLQVQQEQQKIYKINSNHSSSVWLSCASLLSTVVTNELQNREEKLCRWMYAFGEAKQVQPFLYRTRFWTRFSLLVWTRSTTSWQKRRQ